MITKKERSPINYYDDYCPNYEDLANEAFLDNDKNQAIKWAQFQLEEREFVILDTETTGLSQTDEICQIGIIDGHGDVLLDAYVKPTCKISLDAMSIHGITEALVENALTLPEIWDAILNITTTRKVLIYNAQYDIGRLNYLKSLHKLHGSVKAHACVMQWYSQFVGDWNDYYNNYRWQKSPSGDHSAIGDCRATLKVIEKMAATEIIESKPININS